jgi:Family of unknown function (DUF5961)
MPAESRSYRVHLRDIEGSAVRILQEASFEAAAVAYAEDFEHAGHDGQALKIVVRDLETGHEHCFLVDLDMDMGEAASRG